MAQPSYIPPSAQAAEKELESIRAEIAAVGQLGNDERALLRSYGTQIASLKRDLALVKKQIQFETQRRAELEHQLQREQQEVIPPEHIEAVRRRDQDIAELRAEKAAMLEWLQRGVSEAQRITMQVEQLKANNETVRATEAELSRDERRLKQMQERMQLEIDESKTKIGKMKETIAALEEHAEHQGSLTSVTEDILRSALSDVDRLSADAEQLKVRARDVETIEVAVSCLAASARRAEHNLSLIHNAVLRGEEPKDDDGYDSEEEADSTNSTTVVMSSTKARLGRCDALLLTTWSALKTFEQDQRVRTQREMKNFAATLAKSKAELEELRLQLRKEMEQNQIETDQRVQQLRGFIAMREEALKKEMERQYDGTGDDMESAGSPSGFNLLRHIQEQNAIFESENSNLKVQNSLLQAKAAALNDDYTAVKELKTRYRDLEAQKTVLSHSIKDAEASNRELKFFLNEDFSGFEGMGGMPELKKNKRPPWRHTTLEAGPL